MNAKAMEMTEEELKDWNQMWKELEENIEDVLKNGKDLAKWQKK